ncbi:AI-2E family transporter [Marinibactrum halimedae]|uniref:AI-2E family transporter n=1 Tax=Marinibactrum halimedae TaxID=1444977 RepID=A0AA37WQ40_9GAMM|nr:AI-2E family transporter [Marinibactrum halimedae]MCD9457980.1 AI-2E family transporter [Marinibactrum halimedae]GLS27606.1 AI-2E family transporter [Marinibactrum halimedae]
MLTILGNWVHRYFSDEEAVLLAILLVSSLLIVLTMGAVLAPMIASCIIAFLMQGLVQHLKALKIPHVVAVSIAFLVLVGFLVLAFLVILPGLWYQLKNLFAEFPRMMGEWQQLLLVLPERYPSLISEAQVKDLHDLMRHELGELGQGIVTFSIANVPVLMAVLVYLVLVPILVFFFLKDSQTILTWCASFLPRKRPVMSKIWAEMNLQIANYVRGKVIEIIIVAVASYITFALMGVNYALLLALAVGLSVVIPYIGAAVVTIPVAMIGFFQWGWGNELFWLMFAYGVIQALDGNILVPLLFSEAVNLHPVAIILSVLVFGGLWGFWGVFFAIPLATFTKAIFNAWPLADEAAQLSSQEP